MNASSGFFIIRTDRGGRPGRFALSSTSFPTIEELSSDPFMKQVSHGSEIVALMRNNKDSLESDENSLSEMISAQLR